MADVLDAINDKYRSRLYKPQSVRDGFASDTAMKLAMEAQQRGNRTMKDTATNAIPLFSGASELTTTIGEEVGVRVTLGAEAARQETNPIMQAEMFARELVNIGSRKDPNWNPRKNTDQLQSIEEMVSEFGLNPESPEAIDLYQSESLLELHLTGERIRKNREELEEVQKAGNIGKAAYLLGGFADPTNLLAGTAIYKTQRNLARASRLDKYVKDGILTKDEAAALGSVRTRSENMLAGAEAGITSSALLESAYAEIDPTANLDDVLATVAISGVLGSTLGGLSPTTKIDRIVQDLQERRIVEAFNKEDFEPVQRPNIVAEGSVGAAQAGGRADVFVSPSSAEKLNIAWDFLDANPQIEAAFRAMDDFKDVEGTAATRIVQNMAERAYSAINKTGLVTDYDRLIRDSGSIGKYLAYHFLESPIGQVVNNRSAHAVGENINMKASIEYAPNTSAHYRAWAKDNGINWQSRRYWFGGFEDFQKRLRSYRDAVNSGYKPENVHPSIVKASEDMDRAMQVSLNNLKKYGVEGFEDVEFKAGHMRRMWSATAMTKVEQEIGTDALIQSIKRGIMREAPEIEEDLAFTYATAIWLSPKRGEGNPAMDLGSVSASGRTLLEEAILYRGLAETAEDAKAQAEAILYQGSDRGTVKTSRGRLPVDMTTQIQGTKYTLSDLTDGNVYANTERMLRAQANHSAMASVGIQERDKAVWVQAAIDEAKATNRDPNAAAKAVQDMFDMFGEGSFGNMNPNVSRLNKLARASYLPQLGITQIAEAGVAMGEGGIRGWTHYAGKTIPDMVKGKDSQLMNDLWGLNEWVGDHRDFVITDHLDEAMSATDDAPKILGLISATKTDMVLDKSMRALGYTSGFYKMNEVLHVTSALTLNNYMVKSIAKGKNSRRLKAMGVDDDFRAVIQKHIDNGNIEFGPEGHVARMNAKNWSPDELLTLQIITRRNMDRAVQKTARGEGHSWEYDNLGSLFTSLKSYVLTATQKQLIRNARMADPEALQMLLTTTGTAALAYSAKQIANGNIDKLDDIEYMSRGALGWSSMISPALFFLDPISFMVGADKIDGSPLPFNEWRYGHQGLIGLPAGLSALNQLANVGRLPADIIDGDGLDYRTVQALQAIPLIGRSYPMVPIMESLKD